MAQERTQRLFTINPELQEELYKYYVEDPRITTIELQTWLKQQHKVKATLSDIGLVIQRFKALSEKDVKDHIKEKVNPLIGKHIDRLNKANDMITAAMQMVFTQMMAAKKTSDAPFLAKLYAESKAGTELYLKLIGAYSPNSVTINQELSEADVDKLVAKLEAMAVPEEKDKTKN